MIAHDHTGHDGQPAVVLWPHLHLAGVHHLEVLTPDGEVFTCQQYAELHDVIHAKGDGSCHAR